jgi:hypothetical protein
MMKIPFTRFFIYEYIKKLSYIPHLVIYSNLMETFIYFNQTIKETKEGLSMSFGPSLILLMHPFQLLLPHIRSTVNASFFIPHVHLDSVIGFMVIRSLYITFCNNKWGELTATYRWNSWVWEITDCSWRLEENYQSCKRNLWNIPQINKENWKW